MATDSFLTSTEIMAAATEWLEQNGYKRVEPLNGFPKYVPDQRFFEDPYQIVSIAVFDSWDKLRDSWATAQSTLVELISKYVRKGEPKTWEGYLVLLTPGLLPLSSVEEAKDIRYNTTRVRKLLATGEQLGTLEEVRRTLMPLLPLATQSTESEQPASVLDLLPHLFADSGVGTAVISALLDAFSRHKPLMERLHQVRLDNANN